MTDSLSLALFLSHLIYFPSFSLNVEKIFFEQNLKFAGLYLNVYVAQGRLIPRAFITYRALNF